MVKVTAAPTNRQAARHEVKLTIAEAAGPARQEAKLVVHVIDPYIRPALPGVAELPKKMVKAHRSRAYWYGTSDRRREDYGPVFDGDGNMVGATPQFTVYDVAGKGYGAFSAEVKVDSGRRHVGESAGGKKLNFNTSTGGSAPRAG